MMMLSITESAGISHGYLLPSQILKTQLEYSVGGKSHTGIKFSMFISRIFISFA